MLTKLKKTEMLAVCLAALALLTWIIKTTPLETVPRDGEWHYSYARKPVFIQDGTTATGTVMTRWGGSSWEHRSPNRDEAMALDTAPVLGPSAQ